MTLGHSDHKRIFSKSHFELKTWAKFATERLHTMSAHVMFFLRYLLMLSLKVIVLLVGVFPTSKNKAMPVGIVPQVKVNCCFFPITPYPNLQYCKMQSSPTCRIHLHALQNAISIRTQAVIPLCPHFQSCCLRKSGDFHQCLATPLLFICQSLRTPATMNGLVH